MTPGTNGAASATPKWYENVRGDIVTAPASGSNVGESTGQIIYGMGNNAGYAGARLRIHHDTEGDFGRYFCVDGCKTEEKCIMACNRCLGCVGVIFKAAPTSP